MSELLKADWITLRLDGAEQNRLYERGQQLAAEKTTVELIALWNGVWPANEVIDGVYLEHVYLELHARGEGEHATI